MCYERSTPVMKMSFTVVLQGYLAHEKPNPPMTLHQDYALGAMVVLGLRRLFISEVIL